MYTLVLASHFKPAVEHNWRFNIHSFPIQNVNNRTPMLNFEHNGLL